jgi:hypothetical protein
MKTENQSLYFARGHVAMNLLLHKGHWGQGTASHASHPVNAELPVLCGLSIPYAELSLEVLQNDLPAPYVAGRTQTDFDRVLSRRMKPELIVKGGHSVDFAGGEVKVFGYPVEGFRGQISELFLNSLKKGNKIYTVVSKGLKACIQFLEFFSADVVCHGIEFLLRLDPLHGAVNALEAVTKKEAKPLQNTEPQSRIAEHQSPDLGSIEKDSFGRFLA